MYAGQVDLVHKADQRRVVWISASTFYFQTVYPAVKDSLQKRKDAGLAQSASVTNLMHVVLHGFVSDMKPHL